VEVVAQNGAAKMTAARQNGTVKVWKERRRFGFLTTADHRDIYFHETEWAPHNKPRPGERVSFVEDVGHDERPIARQITRE